MENQRAKRPSAADAALTLLAGSLADRELLYRAIEAGIEPQDFEQDRYRSLWKAILDLVGHGDRVDVDSVVAAAHKDIDEATADLLRRACSRWPGSALVF